MARAVSRIFAKGVRVEVCDFRDGYAFPDLQDFNGRQGAVMSIETDGEEIRAFVRLDDSLGNVAFPIQALKPLE